MAGLGQQVDDLRAAGYGRTDIIGSDVTVINATSALYRGTLSRQPSDGSEINRIREPASSPAMTGSRPAGICAAAV